MKDEEKALTYILSIPCQALLIVYMYSNISVSDSKA